MAEFLNHFDWFFTQRRKDLMQKAQRLCDLAPLRLLRETLTLHIPSIGTTHSPIAFDVVIDTQVRTMPDLQLR